MPEFGYMTIKGRQVYDDPDARRKFLAKKPDDYRGFEKHRGIKRAKSDPQLGYYWGLLAPEVSKALIALGWTVTIGKGKTAFERLWDRGGDDKQYTDTHEWLKKNAARIGEQGEYVTLSEQDLDECRKFIDNVIWICEHWLNMDKEKLEAKRPKTKGTICQATIK